MNRKPELPALDSDEVYYARALQTLMANNDHEQERWTVKDIILNGLTIVYYLLIFSMLGLLASMAFDRSEPMEIVRREMVSQIVAPGEPIKIRTTRKILRACEMTRQFVIWDGADRRHEFMSQTMEAYAPNDEPFDEVIGPTLPYDAAPGNGRVMIILAFDCNPLQKATGWSIKMINPILTFQIIQRS